MAVDDFPELTENGANQTNEQGSAIFMRLQWSFV